jgi:hypothetical protein
MPQSAGTTGNLYSDPDNPGSGLGAPPSAPTPVPPPVAPQPVVAAQPVPTKRRMADETADGKIRDTSTEALEPRNDLGFRNLTDESENAPKPPAEAAPPAPPAEPPKPAEAAPVPEKVYAGKFKTPEDLEKAYQESESRMTRAMQEAADLRKQAAAAPPPAPVPKTTEQIAAEEADKNRFLQEFVSDPKGVITRYQQQAVQQTQVALTAQRVAEQWRTENPDLAEHEVRVAFEATYLAQSDPELAKNPAALLTKATDNFRQFTGKLRTDGAKEALTQQTRVIPLLSNTAPAPATEQPPPKAPQTPSDTLDAHVRWLKEQEQRSHRGLRR